LSASISAVNWVIPRVRARSDAVPGGGIDRDERLVIVVVDFSQVAQLGRGQRAVRTQEAAPDGVVTALLERRREPGLVIRLDRSDLEVHRRRHYGVQGFDRSRDRETIMA
jgi:hypothetical protein